jgi:hypothetical protein
MPGALSTAAREAIRISEAYLPHASNEQKKALSMEIVNAINLCEAELARDITGRLSKLVRPQPRKSGDDGS